MMMVVMIMMDYANEDSYDGDIMMIKFIFVKDLLDSSPSKLGRTDREKVLCADPATLEPQHWYIPASARLTLASTCSSTGDRQHNKC